mgnify:CR=1 FL=1
MAQSKVSNKVKIEPKAKGVNRDELPNPRWFAPVMFGFMLLGLIWILLYYITGAQLPLGSLAPVNIGSWNILVGFGILMIGFVMTTRWK